MEVIHEKLKKDLRSFHKVSDFETRLVSSCRQYLTQRIDFKLASSTDTYLEHLRKVYKPINQGYRVPKKKVKREMDSSKEDSHDNSSTILDGIPKPRQVLYDPEKIELGWSEIKGVGAGLANMGNTCFLNSVIQCLTYTPPLINFLYSGHHKISCTIQGFCAMCELHRHVTRTFNSKGNVVRPVPIVQNLKVVAKHFRLGRQEDAHEFLRYFVDALQKSCLHGHPVKMDPFSKHTTVIHQIFGGYHRSEVCCLECHCTSNTFDPLLDISLDIKGCSSLTRALERSIKPDVLDDENRYACPFCKKLTKAQKRFTIHRPPNVLTIQLKRFDYNSIFEGKINKMIEYKDHLNIRPYMSDTQGPAEWYSLYGVLVHFGYSCHSGHYYCYVKNSNKTWYSLNDAQVQQVSSATALSQEAYLLFYIRNKNYIPPKDETKDLKQETESKLSDDRDLFNDTAKKNVDKMGAPLVKIHSKPMGVVTPSPKTNFAPKQSKQISTPKPEQSKQIQTIKQIATDESFELRKSSSQKLSVVVQPPPPPPPPPPSPTPPPPKTPSFPAKPGFTPRSVLKSNKPKPSLPPLSSLAVKKEISLEDGTMRETDFSLSAIIGPKLPSSKNPKVALVQPQPHVTQKPVARVPPSPQLRNVSDEESPHKMKVIKDIVKKHDIKSEIQSEDVSEPQTCSGDNTQAGTHSSEWNVSNSLPTAFGPTLPPDTSKNVTPIKKGLGERKEKVKVVFKQSTKKPHKQRITETESDDAFENPKDPKVAYSEVKSSEKRKHRKRHHQSSLSSDDHHFKRKKRRQRSPSPDYSDKEEVYKCKRLSSEDNYSKKKREGRHRKHKYRRYTYDTSSEEESEHEFKRRKRDEGRSHGSERSRQRQHSPESRFSEYRSPSVERHRRRPGKITEVAWDASVNHHKHKESQKTSKTNLFEGRDSQVQPWEGERSTTESSKTEETVRRGRDEWDKEFDRGKLKKQKSKKYDDGNWNKNSFQDYQSRKNRSHRSGGDSYHHHHRHS